MTFEGFPDEGLVFYEGLEADNSKTYWTRSRQAYDASVRAPMQALCDELAGEFGTAKLFRPYRDVRFSNDKTPYKTHQGAVAHQEGRGAGARVPADGRLQVHHGQVGAAQHVREGPEDMVPALVVERPGGAGIAREGTRVVDRGLLHLPVGDDVPPEDELHPVGRGGTQQGDEQE